MLCEDDVWRRLDSPLPRSLTESYDDVYEAGMKSLDEEDQLIPVMIFRLMLCAARHVTTAEFSAILAAMLGRNQFETSRILGSSFSLLDYDRTLDRFRFGHVSVSEYLSKKEIFRSELCHKSVATACLEITLNQHSSRNDALHYGVAHWPHHTQNSKKERQDPHCSDLLTKLLAPESEHFTRWTELIKTIKHRHAWIRSNLAAFCASTPPCSVFVICAYGFPEYLNLWSHLDLIHLKNDIGLTPLDCAKITGYPDVVMRIVDSSDYEVASKVTLRGDFSFSSSNIRLDGQLQLQASCGAGNGTDKDSCISLDRCLVNSGGELR